MSDLFELDTQQLMNAPPRSPDRGVRLEQLVAIVMAAWTVFGLAYLAVGRPLAASVDFAVAFCTGLLWLFVRRGSGRHNYIFGQFNLFFSVAGLASVSLVTGAQDAMGLWYFAAVPPLAVYQHGFREGAIWALISVGAIVFVHTSPAFLNLDPEFVSRGWEVGFGQAFLVLMVLGFGTAANALTEDFVEKIWWREAAVREKAIEAQSVATELETARDRALKELDMRAELLANMSHEIRTPLNGVLGMTRVLMETSLTPEQRQMVRTIDKSGKSLLGVINDVLDFSKLEAGEVELEILPFDLRECIEDVLDLFSGAAYEKDLELAYQIRPGANVRVEGDINRLRQVLTNLISNAIKFTDEGDVEIIVDAAGELTQFEVRDTGIGISDYDKDRLFESFTQLSPSTGRRYGGSGLGLAISRRIAEAMGGSMRVESTPGEGSSFFFTARLAESAAVLQTSDLTDPMKLLNQNALVASRDRASLRSLETMTYNFGMELTVAQPDSSGRGFKDALKLVDEPSFGIFFDGDWTPADLDLFARTYPDAARVLVAPLADISAPSQVAEHDFKALVLRPLRYRQVRQVFEALLDDRVLEAPRSLSRFDASLAKRKPLKILIAEDHPVNQQVAVSMLERLGYEPDVVETGKEAIVNLRRRRYDLILMDLHMPGMDGLETTRKIRKSMPDEDHTPWIVAMTANVGDDQRRECLEHGMNDFLGKPFEVESLIRVLESVGEPLDAESEAQARRPSDAFDRDRLDELRALFANNPERYVSLVANHIETGSSLIEEVRQGLREGNHGRLEFAAHGLKSSAAMFGAPGVSDLAAEIERFARAEQIDEVQALLPMLEEAWDTTCEKLEAELDHSRNDR